MRVSDEERMSLGFTMVLLTTAWLVMLVGMALLAIALFLGEMGWLGFFAHTIGAAACHQYAGVLWAAMKMGLVEWRELPEAKD